MADERFGVQLDLTGEERFQNAANRVKELEAQFNALQSIINRGAPGWEVARRNIDGVAASLDKARTAATQAASAMAQASAANQRFQVSSPSMPSAAGGAKADGSRATAAGMTVLAVGAAVDDLQYGFRGVLNNLPLIAMGLAALAGVAAPLAMAIAGITAVVSTLTYVAYNSIPAVKGAVDGMWEWAKTAAAVGSRVVGLNLDGSRSGYTPESQTYSYDKQKDDIAAAEKLKADNAKRAVAAEKAFDSINTMADARAKAFKDAVALSGGGESVRKAAKADGNLLARALAGDEGAIGDVIKQATQGDPAIGGKLSKAYNVGMEGAGDPLAAWKEVNAWRESLKNAATDAENLAMVQEGLNDAYKAGTISAQTYINRTDDVSSAQERLARDEARAAEEAAREAAKLAAEKKKAQIKLIEEAAELEAAAEEERWAKVKQAREQAEAAEMAREAKRGMIEVNRLEARQNSRVDFFSGAYGQAFGGDAAGAIYRRAARGQSFDDAEKAIKDQVEARLSAIRDPALRSQSAARIAAEARDLAERNAMGFAVGQDLRQQQLNQIPGALGVMMRQQAARFGGAGDVAGPEQKMQTAVDKFDRAVERLHNGQLEAVIRG